MCNGGPVHQPEQIPAFVPSLFINIPMGGGKKERKERKGGKGVNFEFFEFWLWWDLSLARVAYFLGVIGCSSTLWFPLHY